MREGLFGLFGSHWRASRPLATMGAGGREGRRRAEEVTKKERERGEGGAIVMWRVWNGLLPLLRGGVGQRPKAEGRPIPSDAPMLPRSLCAICSAGHKRRGGCAVQGMSHQHKIASLSRDSR